MGMKSKSNHFPSGSGAGGNFKRQGGFNFKLNLQLFAQMPSKEAQIKHIMSERKGHIIDTPENRSLLESVSSDEKNYVGKDSHGNTRYVKIVNGKQVWVSVRNGIIQDGGINEKPFKKLYDKKGEFKK